MRENCLIDNPVRHPAPTSENLGLLCLRAIVSDATFSPKVQAQAAALAALLKLQPSQSTTITAHGSRITDPFGSEAESGSIYKIPQCEQSNAYKYSGREPAKCVHFGGFGLCSASVRKHESLIGQSIGF